MIELNVNSNEAGQRLDKMLGKYLNDAPSSFIYKMLRKKNITLNGKKATGNEKLAEGDLVKLFLADETIEKFRTVKCVSSKASATNKPANIKPLDIIYEDENVLFANKPVGILSQKAKDTDYSINEQIIDYLIEKKELTTESLRSFTPSVCNRLDRNTSGIITFGKTLVGVQELSKVFRSRNIGKFYRCVVFGEIKAPESIEGFLIKDEKTNTVSITKDSTEGAVKIATEYNPLKTNGKYTLLEIKLLTGKTHQIRAHLSSIGHPIIGDPKYGNPLANEGFKLRFQLLHSYRLEFPTIEDGPLSNLSNKKFVAKLPSWFDKTCKDIF